MAKFAEVVVDIADRKVDRPFHYHIPEQLTEKISPGVRVRVPFGARKIEGYVIGLTSTPSVAETKSILEVIEGVTRITDELLQLARWMALYYMCPLVTVLQSFFPRGSFSVKKVEWASLVAPITEDELMKISRRAPKQGQIAEALQLKGSLPVQQVLKELGAGRKSLTALVEKGIIRLTFQEGYSSGDAPLKLEEPYILTEEQTKAFSAIQDNLLSDSYQTFLLHGVTGSGKTEIYFRSIAQTIKAGYQAIVLFPEISLTIHLIERFKNRFGSQVAILHSGLTVRERQDTLRKISLGQASVIMGARSAVFAPVPKLGLIILDEEHETSYQQDVTPKYHAREVAIVRGFLNKATVILGSATPSLESYYKAEEGKFQLIQMVNRVEQQNLPKVLVVDLRQELRTGNDGLFSRLLQEKLKDRLKKGQQSILFLNRRGYGNFYSCRDCGQVIKCKNCDVSMVYYAGKNQLKCNYCGYHQDPPTTCPTCGGNRIRHLGAGTEKVEDELQELLPKARIIRIDSDTINKKGEQERLFKLFEEGQADVMIGTQMVAKGLDFPEVTLVGVILADQMLSFADFRARERTFQLLTQVAGRAGRGKLPGEVIVQAYSPEDWTIEAAREHDYEKFYRQEIRFRQVLKYPPFSHLARILVSSEREAQAEKACREIANIIFPKQKDLGITLLGPSQSPVAKINNIYRWQIYVKGPDIKKIRHLIAVSLNEAAQKKSLPRDVHFSLDIDPLGMV